MPTPPAPAGRYVPSVRTGRWVFVSGQGPVQADGRTRGDYGSLADAARLAMANVLAALDGARPVRLLVMVATADARDLDAVAAAVRECCPGEPAVSVVGLVALPFGIPVEIEAVGEWAGSV